VALQDKKIQIFDWTDAAISHPFIDLDVIFSAENFTVREALADVRDGEAEYIKGYGTANPKCEPVTPETPFLLASVSKSFTALGVMQLVEAGKIELDAPVQKYLPWFTATDGDGAEITVAHLLYQTSGFSEFDGMQMNLRLDHPDVLEMDVRGLSRIHLQFLPGEGWEYSNINYTVFGLLVQEVSGQRYEAYIQENILTRLEMAGSYTSLTSARSGNAAFGYYPFMGMPQMVDTHLPATVIPAAGLWSSAAGMSRYLITHLGDGSEVGLTSQGLAQLHALAVEIEPGFCYAMGWFRSSTVLDPEFLRILDTDLEPTDDLFVLWHEGGWKEYKSIAFLMPGQDSGVVLLMNTEDPTFTSAFRYFAWDVTLIANGGDAYYFQPNEEIIVRYSRWIFSGLALFLLIGFFLRPSVHGTGPDPIVLSG
jgi:CubicO group peptidase (beta-lactamase class C family)